MRGVFSSMGKKILRKLTKHLVIASKHVNNDEFIEVKNPKPIKREFPKLPPIPKLIPRLPRLEPTITPQEARKALVNPSIDLGRLNQFISEPTINVIDCQGPNKKIKVKKSGIVNETNVVLNPGEISEIINQFSKQTKAPLTQVFRARLQNLSITAFISPVIGTKFLIVKE